MPLFWSSRRNGSSDIPFAWYWKGKPLRKGRDMGDIIRPVRVRPYTLEGGDSLSDSTRSSPLTSDTCISHLRNDTRVQNVHEGQCPCSQRREGSFERYVTESHCSSLKSGSGTMTVYSSRGRCSLVRSTHTPGHRSNTVFPGHHFRSLPTDGESSSSYSQSSFDYSRNPSFRQIRYRDDDNFSLCSYASPCGPSLGPPFGQRSHSCDTLSTNRRRQLSDGSTDTSSHVSLSASSCQWSTTCVCPSPFKRGSSCSRRSSLDAHCPCDNEHISSGFNAVESEGSSDYSNSEVYWEAVPYQ